MSVKQMVAVVNQFDYQPRAKRELALLVTQRPDDGRFSVIDVTLVNSEVGPLRASADLGLRLQFVDSAGRAVRAVLRPAANLAPNKILASAGAGGDQPLDNRMAPGDICGHEFEVSIISRQRIVRVQATSSFPRLRSGWFRVVNRFPKTRPFSFGY